MNLANARNEDASSIAAKPRVSLVMMGPVRPQG